MKKSSSVSAALAAFVLVCASPLFAQGGEPAPGNTGAAEAGCFHLFNPRPYGQTRGFTSGPEHSDRPFTVDAGHFQLDVGAFRQAWDWPRGHTDSLMTFAETTVTAGVLNNLDVSLTWTGAFWRRTLQRETDELVINGGGAGDLVAAAKLNLWGNDGGEQFLFMDDTHAAIEAWIKAPTNSNEFGNGNVEAGLRAPTQWTIGSGFSAFGMYELSILDDRRDGNTRVVLGNSDGLRYQPCECFGAFVEVTERADFERSPWFVSLNLGAQGYMLKNHLSLYGAVNVGLSHVAPDIAFAFGLSARF